MGLKTVFCNGKCEDCYLIFAIDWFCKEECKVTIKPKIIIDGWIDEMEEEK